MSAKSFDCKVAVVMGSKSDYETMKDCVELLHQFGIAVEPKVVSAHRTPHRMYEFATTAHNNGVEVIIAAAGGAAHLPGMIAALTHLPVIGVPIKSSVLNGVDSLLSIVQMPFGVPVCTMAIGSHGAKNAALAAISILSLQNQPLREKLIQWRLSQATQTIQNIDL